MRLSRENLLSYDPSENCQSLDKKPIEIYMFVDPLCPECWALEPIIKKLQVEYGKYFSIKHVLSGRLATLNMNRKKRYETIAELWEKTASRTGMSCDGSLWFENPVSSPYLASIAIKSAELQGKKKGIRFLRRLQEVLFLEKQNVSNFEVLKNCARSVGLDVEEFVTDIHSETAAKAFQCDLKITNEMDVQEIPTLVFFNANVEEEGIKITGLYPYEVYVQILEEMLQQKPDAAQPPSLEQFLMQYKMVASKEVAVVYDITVPQAEKELKKLMLKQMVEQIPAKYGMFWRYLEG
ncbi:MULTISPECIES: ClpXP adapter SpxH family protein [unclassified Mesobacillus]|uniref:ClpXP adapter SpxH family protein n=1 Tax=unclassified Mesobacillus TaxID=2675270 RepID=UPI00203E4752|nr:MULTISPECIES: ClpXP adapter SpxH family protein [unclassified Mesobacillus]MCM3124833.1 DsbA family protein [Mesobacillus sp. MER 33]MCM3232858.1 DsbA family protein [Mesobacillus sp. MER 48]